MPADVVQPRTHLDEVSVRENGERNLSQSNLIDKDKWSTFDVEPRMVDEGRVPASNRCSMPVLTSPRNKSAEKPIVCLDPTPSPVDGDHGDGAIIKSGPIVIGRRPAQDVHVSFEDLTVAVEDVETTDDVSQVIKKPSKDSSGILGGLSANLSDLSDSRQVDWTLKSHGNMTYRASIGSGELPPIWDGAVKWWCRTCCRCLRRRRQAVPNKMFEEEIIQANACSPPRRPSQFSAPRPSQFSAPSICSDDISRTASDLVTASASHQTSETLHSSLSEKAAPNLRRRLPRTVTWEGEGTLTEMYRWEGEKLRTLEPTNGQSLRVWTGVWNLAGLALEGAHCGRWLQKKPLHHIYAVGFCEVKAGASEEVKHFLGDDYDLVAEEAMSGIQVGVFAWKGIAEYVWDVRQAQVATGVANLLGNKGAAQVSFRLGKTKLLFICCHLAAGEGSKMMDVRTENLERILLDSPLRQKSEGLGLQEEFDRVFLMGDLNIRVEAARKEVETWLENEQPEQCMTRDQLLPLLNGRSSILTEENHGLEDAGLWPLFAEAPINFPPTYKYDPGTQVYDSSPKQRVPSWTDRILWRRSPHIAPMSYSSVMSLTCSDHRPIFAQFEVVVNLQPDESGGDAALPLTRSATKKRTGRRLFSLGAKEMPEAHTILSAAAAAGETEPIGV